jgi:putative transcriptional regulator
MDQPGGGMPLRNRLKELRARHDLTQEELGDKVGVSRQTIISIEKGGYSPSVTLALRIAQVLHVPLERAFWLENGEEVA